MDNYTVYMHRFPNGKVYIGITRVAPEKRWRNGKGYSENRFMQFAINKYGWENSDAHKGKKLTEEQKKKIGDAHRGKKRSEQAKKNMSVAQKKARKEHPEMWDKVHEKRKKPVIQISVDGAEIKIWPSAPDVELSLGIKRNGIVNCCAGRAKTAGGYRWEYANK